MLYAHLTKNELTISTDIEGRIVVATLPVSGKREARAVAAQHGAKPWNF